MVVIVVVGLSYICVSDVYLGVARVCKLGRVGGWKTELTKEAKSTLTQRRENEESGLTSEPIGLTLRVYTTGESGVIETCV